jgi:hypothetical protein
VQGGGGLASPRGPRYIAGPGGNFRFWSAFRRMDSQGSGEQRCGTHRITKPGRSVTGLCCSGCATPCRAVHARSGRGRLPLRRRHACRLHENKTSAALTGVQHLAVRAQPQACPTAPSVAAVRSSAPPSTVWPRSRSLSEWPPLATPTGKRARRSSTKSTHAATSRRCARPCPAPSFGITVLAFM